MHGQSRRIVTLSFVGFVMAISATTTSAQTYNAGADMLANETGGGDTNPNGVWRYGFRGVTASAALTLYTVHEGPVVGGFQGWNDPTSPCCGALSHVLVNAGPATGNPQG